MNDNENSKSDAMSPQNRQPAVERKPKYKLEDLVAETHGELPRVLGWDELEPRGLEKADE